MVTKAEKKALRLKQRKKQIDEQRAVARAKRQKKQMINWAIISIVVLIVAGFGYSTYMKNQGFAECLTKAGVGMYGTDWCPHCQDQKQMFGKSFKKVTYINCDANPKACQAEGVTGYPTWIYPDGDRTSGVQSFAALSEKTGCQVQ